MPTHSLARWLFLRALGAVYLVAFVSLWVQIAGLVGSRGILPAATLLDWVRAQAGPERYRLLPTLFWLHPTDGFLSFLCGGGAFLSVLLIAGVRKVHFPVGLLTNRSGITAMRRADFQTRVTRKRRGRRRRTLANARTGDDARSARDAR